MELLDYLNIAVEKEVSDLFLVVGSPACGKYEGKVQPLGGEKLLPSETERLIREIYERADRSMD